MPGQSRRIEPGPGQESVWDYPRPPRLEPSSRLVRVVFAGQLLAESRRALRVLETSHPPNYYIPPEDVALAFLAETASSSHCEWKGRARYYAATVGRHRVEDVAWSYPRPTTTFAALAGYLSFYPGRVDACYLDDERVMPQEGSFYGGWITSEIVGPFKGGPGSWGW
jgi:uncharacterized protein (DUF427 family)